MCFLILLFEKEHILYSTALTKAEWQRKERRICLAGIWQIDNTGV